MKLFFFLKVHKPQRQTGPSSRSLSSLAHIYCYTVSVLTTLDSHLQSFFFLVPRVGEQRLARGRMHQCSRSCSSSLCLCLPTCLPRSCLYSCSRCSVVADLAGCVLSVVRLVVAYSRGLLAAPEAMTIRSSGGSLHRRCVLVCAWVFAPGRDRDVEGGQAASTFKSRFRLLVVEFVLHAEDRLEDRLAG